MMKSLARGVRNVPVGRQYLRHSPLEAASGVGSRYPNGGRSINSSSLAGYNLNWKRQKDEDDEVNRIHNQPLIMSTVMGSYNSSNPQRRFYSVTTKSESATLALGLGAFAATAKAAQYAARAYQEYQASIPEEPEEKETDSSKASEENASSSSEQKQSNSGTGGKRENIFSQFFDVGSKYYEGGFEEKMTRREAALILGVRESSTEKRIKEAHRKLLILNHPDTGGSTYISGKVNEAKDLLLKAKGR